MNRTLIVHGCQLRDEALGRAEEMLTEIFADIRRAYVSGVLLGDAAGELYAVDDIDEVLDFLHNYQDAAEREARCALRQRISALFDTTFGPERELPCAVATTNRKAEC